MKSIAVKISATTIIYFILIVAFALRLYNLNYAGLWNDELYTANMANPGRSISNVIFRLKLDIHPPLHNILSNLWSRIFSYNDTSLRVFNVLIGVFGAFSIYKLAKLLFNSKVALYAMLLVVVNSFLIQYSQEVRAYALLFLLSNFSYFFYVKLTRGLLTRKNIIGYGLVTTALIYTHYFGLFVVASQVIILFLVVKWKDIKANLLRYGLAFVIPGLLFLFWAPTMYKHLTKTLGSWRVKPTPEILIEYFQGFFNDYIISSIALILFFLTGLYFLLKLFIKLPKVKDFVGKRSKELLIIFLWALIYFLIPYLKSTFSSSMMGLKYFIAMTGPIIIMLAFYIDRIKGSQIRNGIVNGLIIYSVLVLFLKSNPYYHSATSYREIAQEAKAINNDAPVLYLCKDGFYFDYYLHQNNFMDRREDFVSFLTLVKKDSPKEYFVFLDLRLTPEKFKNGVPVIPGYEEVSSKTFRNAANIKTVQLVHYKKTDQSI
ncbi:MAG: glycosyltransferase family 39 protein [Bacteroidia bacterium]|nr:glycosyltransferase family 39 protein [Bacteroidia bacterium]NNF31723.1 hypothetical protein [Flavobacteriaceae bacterium]NNJ81116.1 hypothetical protein [Flavobacteriaceae bacterium]NNK55237.1 hypothetical protein [Flavobacteriaceae bacterium]NNM10232.1 hypothetical protein [Flavobacteriaceae bacterium]